MDPMTPSIGWLIPAWILGAPLLFAVLELMRTPRPVRSAVRAGPHP